MTHETIHVSGQLIIATQWQGETLSYDVRTRSGTLIASGFDKTSGSEDAATEVMLRNCMGGRFSALCKNGKGESKHGS
jgi:hypothetical protein